MHLNDNIVGVVAEFFICHAVNVMVPTAVGGCSKSIVVIPILIKEFQLSPLPLYVIDHDKIRGLTGELCSPWLLEELYIFIRLPFYGWTCS